MRTVAPLPSTTVSHPLRDSDRQQSQLESLVLEQGSKRLRTCPGGRIPSHR